MLNTVRRDGNRVRIGFSQDPGRPAEPGTSSGAASPFRQPRRVATTLRGSGHSARVPGGQREDPARGLERGTVPNPRRLPRSRHDDEVDASSGALKMLNHQMKSWASTNFIGTSRAAARRKGRLMRRQPKAQTLAPLAGNRGFESTSLQQAVCLSREPRGRKRKAPQFGGGLRVAGDARRDVQAANRHSFALSL